MTKSGRAPHEAGMKASFTGMSSKHAKLSERGSVKSDPAIPDNRVSEKGVKIPPLPVNNRGKILNAVVREAMRMAPDFSENTADISLILKSFFPLKG